jgi:hypothetical protein
LENTSSNQLALQLLDHCLKGEGGPDELLHSLLRQATGPDPMPATHALFSILVERLGDLFEPALCDAYARIFSNVIAFVEPALQANDLRGRATSVSAAAGPFHRSQRSSSFSPASRWAPMSPSPASSSMV